MSGEHPKRGHPQTTSYQNRRSQTDRTRFVSELGETEFGLFTQQERAAMSAKYSESGNRYAYPDAAKRVYVAAGGTVSSSSSASYSSSGSSGGTSWR